MYNNITVSCVSNPKLSTRASKEKIEYAVSLVDDLSLIRGRKGRGMNCFLGGTNLFSDPKLQLVFPVHLIVRLTLRTTYLTPLHFYQLKLTPLDLNCSLPI